MLVRVGGMPARFEAYPQGAAISPAEEALLASWLTPGGSSTAAGTHV